MKDAKLDRHRRPPLQPKPTCMRRERLAIDYADAAELADKSAKALKAFAANQPAVWKALRAQGIFRGHGPARRKSHSSIPARARST